MRFRLLLACAGAAVTVIALFAFAGIGSADPSDLFIAQVPLHRHFIQTANGNLVPVGPQVCEHPELMPAFEQFDYNVHHSFVPGFGTFHTLGPQNGAPGLHNDKGATTVA
jgi:hypothetical protein